MLGFLLVKKKSSRYVNLKLINFPIINFIIKVLSVIYLLKEFFMEDRKAIYGNTSDFLRYVKEREKEKKKNNGKIDKNQNKRKNDSRFS